MPVLQDEININEKISQIRKSSFAQAVSKKSQLISDPEKSIGEKAWNATTEGISNNSGTIGSLAGAGLALYDAYNIATKMLIPITICVLKV